MSIFLVDVEPGRSLFDLGRLLMELQNLLNCPVDIITEKGLYAPESESVSLKKRSNDERRSRK
ncbi:MAG: hypothetical protein AAFU78_17325, partial [Cyanobacteria bacterium J06633_2]